MVVINFDLRFEDFFDHADDFGFTMGYILPHLVVGLRKQVLEHRQRDERKDRQRSDSDHQIEGVDFGNMPGLLLLLETCVKLHIEHRISGILDEFLPHVLAPLGIVNQLFQHKVRQTRIA